VRKALLAISMGFGVLAAPASAFAAWSQGYIVEWYTGPGWKGGDKDVDCPNGDNANPEWAKLLKTTWRTDADVEKIAGEGHLGFGTPLANRGPKPGQNVQRDPTLVPDPHMPGVVGNIGYGFDLDGNQKTGFVSPDGKSKGLDNQVYRALGCHVGFRGGGRKQMRETEVYDDDVMKSGVYSVLVMLSGEGKDPRNDSHVRVGFYLSKDPIVRDAKGEVSRDYSYRVDPDPRFTSVFDAVSKNGVISPAKPLKQLKIREFSARPNFAPDLTLEMPQVAITLGENGTMHADIGGYRNWLYMYQGHAAGSNANEVAFKIDITGMWYNLQKYADWKMPGTKGPNTHISSFYSMEGVPAFLVSPDNHKTIARAEVFGGSTVIGSESPESAGRRMRSLASDPSFRLEGGAAVWPAAATPEIQNAPGAPKDPLAWAKVVTVEGGLAKIPPSAIVDVAPTTASTGAKKAASVAPKPAASVAPKPAASADPKATKQPASYKP
jgi:hypothetical protein